MDIFPPSKIKICKVKNKGRGVMAVKNIKKGEVIEYCPIIILNNKDSAFMKKGSDTLHFYFLEQPDLKRNAFMLGYGSIYNHNDKDPNAELDYRGGQKQDYIFFRAIKEIKKGDEITWDYNFDNGIVEFLP